MQTNELRMYWLFFLLVEHMCMSTLNNNTSKVGRKKNKRNKKVIFLIAVYEKSHFSHNCLQYF